MGEQRENVATPEPTDACDEYQHDAEGWGVRCHCGVLRQHHSEEALDGR